MSFSGTFERAIARLTLMAAPFVFSGTADAQRPVVKVNLQESSLNDLEAIAYGPQSTTYQWVTGFSSNYPGGPQLSYVNLDFDNIDAATRFAYAVWLRTHGEGFNSGLVVATDQETNVQTTLAGFPIPFPAGYQETSAEPTPGSYILWSEAPSYAGGTSFQATMFKSLAEALTQVRSNLNNYNYFIALDPRTGATALFIPGGQANANYQPAMKTNTPDQPSNVWYKQLYKKIMGNDYTYVGN